MANPIDKTVQLLKKMIEFQAQEKNLKVQLSLISAQLNEIRDLIYKNTSQISKEVDSHGPQTFKIGERIIRIYQEDRARGKKLIIEDIKIDHTVEE